MAYTSAAALEMAVKAAAKASPQDTGRVVSAFYFHRFLCRVFANSNDSFILKGGQSVLARTLDARATRDQTHASHSSGFGRHPSATRDTHLQG